MMARFYLKYTLMLHVRSVSYTTNEYLVYNVIIDFHGTSSNSRGEEHDGRLVGG